MRTLKHPAVLLTALLIFVGACATTPQQKAYQTLYTLESSTTAAYDAFIYGACIKGIYKTNDVPQVSKNFDQFQIGMKGAIELAQFNYATIAPSNVVHLGTVVVKSIIEAKAR